MSICVRYEDLHILLPPFPPLPFREACFPLPQISLSIFFAGFGCFDRGVLFVETGSFYVDLAILELSM